MVEAEITTDFVEVQGITRKVWKKTEGDQRLYSFDSKKTWHDTMVAAFLEASENGDMPKGDGFGDQDETNEFQVFLMSLVNEICRLRAGEALRITKDNKKVFIIREEIAMACSSDSIVAVDFATSGD